MYLKYPLYIHARTWIQSHGISVTPVDAAPSMLVRKQQEGATDTV